MMNDLKVVVFMEWTYAPHFGGDRFFYCDWSNSYKDFLSIVDETCEHLSWSIDEEDEEDVSNLNQLLESKSPTKEYLLNFDFDNGGLGSTCLLLTEGENIAKDVIELIKEYFGDFITNDEGTEIDESIGKMFDRALSGPMIYDSIIPVLNLLKEFVERWNDI